MAKLRYTMKTKITNGLSCLLLAALSYTTLSCSNEEITSKLPASIYPKSVTIDLPTELEQLIYVDETGAEVLPMLKGEKVTLAHTIAPEEVTFKEVNWSSTDASVAIVNGNGGVEALSGDGRGYAILQVAPVVFYSGSGIYSVLKVVVSNSLIEAEEITINSSSTEVFAGESLQLTASIQPTASTYKTVKWSSSNERVATVDSKGLVTGQVSEDIQATATITATALDGSQVYDAVEIIVNQIVQPEEVTIDQSFSIASNYLCAIADKSITLSYTTVPAICTRSLIQWSSSDEAIATVENGVVTFNQVGIFGDAVITARCPETGNSSAISLRLEEGLVRELFHDKNNYSWYNAAQSGNGTSSSHVWSYGKVTVTTYTQNATNQRADFRTWSPRTWLHAGKYPIFAIRIDDVMDLYDEVTSRNITFDGSGSCNGSSFSGGLNGNNNKWLHDYKCSDGSHVFIYDMTTQAWATGGVLPSNALATFTTLQLKYADIRTITRQIEYNVYWVQTFKTVDDVKNYLESEGLSYEIIK